MPARILRRIDNYKPLWMATVMALALLLAAGNHGYSSAETAEASLFAADALDEDPQIAALDQTASDLLQQVENGNLEQALGLAGRMSQQMADVPWMKRTTLEGAEGFIRSLVELKALLTAVRPNLPEIRKAAVRVKLASDALLFHEEPMWKQYDAVLRTDLQRLKQAVESADGKAIRARYELLADHAALIRPAVVISKGAGEMNMMMSLLTAFESKLEDRLTKPSELLPLLERIEAAVSILFAYGEQTADAAVTRRLDPLVWTILIGGYILFVLFVVGRRFYAFDKGYVSVSARTKDRHQR